jgi:hypothetical protein
VLLVVAVVGVTTAAPLTARGDAATATKVTAVSPVDSTGKLAPGYQVAHRYSDANCASGSPMTGSSYQCFTPASRAEIYNSCWVATPRKYVDCLVAPWQRKVVRLKVTRDYGDSGGFRKVHKPWGVRLGADTRCLVILGPVHGIHGKPRTYLCNHKLVIAGKVTHHGSHWTANVYRKVRRNGHHLHYTSLGKQAPAVVWFGQPSLKDSGH